MISKERLQNNLPDYFKTVRKVSKVSALSLSFALTANVSAAANTPEEKPPGTDETSQTPIEIFTNQDNPLLNASEIEINNNQVVVFPDGERIDELIPGKGAEEVPPPPMSEVERGTFKKNLFFRKGFSFQDPDLAACGAVGVQAMLNFTARNGDKGEDFIYKINTSYRHEQKLKTFTRKHDALFADGKGTDSLGIVRALNRLGWDKKSTPDEAVYEIKAYKSRKNALKHVVRAIARHDKPVGVLGWGGGHFQVISGMKYEGYDAAFSNDFKPKGFYLSSPLRSDNQVNEYVPYKDFFNGDWNEVLRRYNQGDSPKDNPLTKTKRPASDEWDGRYVIIVPVK